MCYSVYIMKEITSRNNVIDRARTDIARVLGRYKITLPEVMGVGRTEPDSDEKVWKKIRKDYERAQVETLAEMYPKLWRKLQKI